MRKATSSPTVTLVSSGDSFEVVFSNGERQRAELVGADPDSDLAVLKVASLPDGVVLYRWRRIRSRWRQFAVALGSPFGEQGTMTLGIISGLDRSLPSQRTTTTGSTYSLAPGDPNRCTHQPGQLGWAAAEP